MSKKNIAKIQTKLEDILTILESEKPSVPKAILRAKAALEIIEKSENKCKDSAVKQRPLNPYMQFAQANRVAIKKKLEEELGRPVSAPEVAKALGAEWQKLKAEKA